MMTCAELAKAGLFLARDGQGRAGPLLSRSEAKRVSSIMLTCGMYDAAGEFAYRVGLPGKSGVGGGILVIVPGDVRHLRLEPAAGRQRKLPGRHGGARRPFRPHRAGLFSDS